jgi:5S rRNA maturation endonuclease (ribonuclease M5)
MISTRNIISDLEEVPREWVFEYYLNLKEKLTGQNIKMLSAFNVKDKVPSMFVYQDGGRYKFKDFSSGFQGDQIELVKSLFNYDARFKAVNRILTDYQEYLKHNAPVHRGPIQFYDKFKVVDFEMRHWNTLDQKYWTQFKIGSSILSQYNVVPLDFFTMSKSEPDGSITSYKFSRPYVYGYFRNDGELYKIYMPKIPEKKFIKIQNYTQGMDQLKYDSKYLLIVSSLKDLMSFKKIGIGNIECIAPDSENTMIGESTVSLLSKQYNSIIVLFDNDEPGIKAAQRYTDKYGIRSINLDMSKDLSDSVKDYGIEAVRDKLLSLLKQVVV